MYKILCTPFKSKVSISPSPLGPEVKPSAIWHSEPNAPGAHLPSAVPLGEGTKVSLLWENFWKYDYSLICGLSPYRRVWDLIISQVHLFYPSQCCFFFVSSCRRSLLVDLNLFFSGWSEDSCDFGVFMRGDEFRLFLPNYLAHSPARKYFDKSLETEHEVLRESEQ